MRKDLRNVIIANLAQQYGKPFVRPEGDGIVVRNTDYRRGGIIYHIPAELLPDYDTDDFTDPIAGYEMPELVDLVYPELQNKTHSTIRVGCVSHYDSVYDAVARRSITNVTFCPPDKTNYLFITVEDTDRDGEPSNSLFNSAYKAVVWYANRTLGHQGQSQSWIMLVPAGARLTQEKQSAKARSYYAAQTRIVAAAYISGTTPPAIEPYKKFMASQLDEPDSTETEAVEQPENSKSDYNYGSTVTTVNGRLECQSFHFADEMSGEQVWVITPEGYMLRPHQIQDHSEVIFGEIAQFETWHRLPQDCLIIHWQRTSLEALHHCDVIYRPENPTTPQLDRARWIAGKISAEWRSRRSPATGLAASEPNCTWNLTGGED